MKTTIQVENIQCGACSNSIHQSLGTLPGVFGVHVNRIDGEITIDHTDEVSRRQLADQLLSLGYPEAGTVKEFAAAKAGAESFVSCNAERMKK